MAVSITHASHPQPLITRSGEARGNAGHFPRIATIGFRELARLLEHDEPADSALPLANTSDLARRRQTVLVRTALDHLPHADREHLLAYLTALYDPASPTSRLYLQARPEPQQTA